MTNNAKVTEAEKAPKKDDKKEEKPKASESPMRKLAARAGEVAAAGGSPLGSAITAPQAKLMSEALGDKPMARFEPATTEQLRAYAEGGRGSGRTDLPDEAVAALRAFCTELGSRRIWPRKVAAIALALHEQSAHTAKTPIKKEPA